jgi:HK97 family phage major capsid protein
MEKEQKELLDAIKGQVTELVEKGAEASKKEIDSVKAELKKLEDASKSTEVIEEVKRLAADVNAMKEKGKETHTARVNTLADAIVEGFKTLNKEGALKGIKKGEWKNIEVKAAGTMTTANIDAVGTSSIPYSLASIEPGVSRTQRRSPFLLQLVNTGSTNKGIVQWAEQVNVDGAANVTAEGAAKSQADFDIQEASAKVEKVTAYIKVSTEMLDDVDYMDAEIRNELMEIVRLKMDQQILAGNGTSPQLKGILQYATSFAAGTFAAAINGATNFDSLRVAINQIVKENFTPNYIVMHPSDVAAMDLAKDSTGQYIMPPFSTVGNTVIKGLPVIENTGVTEGDFLVGDFTKSIVRLRKDAQISVGHENDDFTKNLVTILCEMRGVHYIKSNHTKAFVKGTFATTNAALETA